MCVSALESEYNIAGDGTHGRGVIYIFRSNYILIPKRKTSKINQLKAQLEILFEKMPALDLD